jgi:peptidase E
LSGKTHLKVLFIPTASSDAEQYINDFIDYYGKFLCCEVDTLKLIKQKVSTKEIKVKILKHHLSEFVALD